MQKDKNIDEEEDEERAEEGVDVYKKGRDEEKDYEYTEDEERKQ